MAKPTQKFFGSLNLNQIKKAVVEIETKTDEYNGEKQLKVTAAQWEDGNISIDIYNGDTKETLKLGNLRISKFNDDAPKGDSPAGDDDMPF